MPILDIQRSGQQIGRIRIGQMVKASSGKMRPAKLSTFRFTTGSRVTADAIAGLYGGTVADWQRGQFEVITAKSEIGVMVPPRDAVISQWYEMWNKGGCVRRCTSQHEQISNGPCLCPHAEDPANADEVADAALKRADMAKLNPPQACKIVTRISLMIPDLPGLGVFRLDSGSYYAASEIGDAAILMQAARDKGVLLPAILRIDQRQRIAGGKTTDYPVPVLEVLTTFRQIVSGELKAGGVTAQLPPAPGEPLKAIAAPDVPRPAVTLDPGNGEGIRPTAGPGHPAEASDAAARQAAAERLAAMARVAVTAKEFEVLARRAEDNGLADELICHDDAWEPLVDYIRDLYRDRAKASA